MFEFNFFINWWIILEILGLISFPIISFFAGNLADRGYGISKMAGLMISSYICFMISYPLGFGFWTMVLSVSILLIVSAFAYFKNRNNIARFFRDSSFIRSVICIEIIFIALFLGFSLVRAYDPDIRDGEKLMELAFVNAIARADHLPFPYPWWSGENLGVYYYFGHYLTAFVSVITSTPTSIGYNLSLAMFFSMTAVISFSAGFCITKKIKYGILAVFFVIFFANIFPLMQIITFLGPNPSNLSIDGYTPPTEEGFSGKLFSGSTTWWSTRIIPWSINEFPYFSFIWADLHHTLMAIPFRIMLIVLCYSLFMRGSIILEMRKNRSEKLAALAFLSLSLGFTIPLSTWDFPVMAMFAFICIFAGGFYETKSKKWHFAKCVLIFGIVIALSLLMFLPTIFDLMTNRGSKVNVEDLRTSLYHFTILFSFFIFVFFSYASLLYWKSRKEIPKNNKSIIKRDRLKNIFKLIIYISLLILICSGIHIVIALLPIIYLIFESISKKTSRNDIFIFILIFMGIFLAMLCEFVNIGGRYISLFKFYLQLWVFWAIASTMALDYIFVKISKRHPLRKNSIKIKTAKAAWLILFTFLFVSSSLYIFIAGYTEIVRNNHGKTYLPTMNGLAYLNGTHSADVDAADWININIKGSPTILEVAGRSYTYTSRISWMTGLPTVLGWEHHVENHLSIPYDEIMSTRNSDIDTIYNTTDNEKAMELINKYNISYIYVGELEREYLNIVVGDTFEIKKYDEEGLYKFSRYPQNYRLVYGKSGVNIYKVVRQ